MASVKYYARASGSHSLELLRVENETRLHVLVNPEPFHKTTLPTSHQEQIISVNPDTLSHIVLLKGGSKNKGDDPYPSASVISSAIELAMISNAIILSSPQFDFWKALTAQLPKRLLSPFPFNDDSVFIDLFSFYNPRIKEKQGFFSRILKAPATHFSMGLSLKFTENTTIGCLSHWQASPKSHLLTDNLVRHFTVLLPLTDQAEFLSYNFNAKRSTESSSKKPLIRNDWEIIKTIW